MAFIAVTAALLVGAALPGQGQAAWDHAAPEPFIKDLVIPVDFAFGGDGYLYYASLTETEIRRIDMETAEADKNFVLELVNATWENGSETGVFSLALDPEFHRNGVLYVSYSAHDEDRPEAEQWTNVLSRFTLTDGSGAAKEEVLLTRPGGLFHNGGRVLIADGHLWWTTGDALNPFMHDPQEHGWVAQEDGDLRGKVLRLDMDGNPASGNPWDDHAYTKGHRNVFGIAWDHDNDRILVTENGNALTDYIYLLKAGANYGWPECEGACEEDHPEYTDPLWQSESTIAPTGATWFRGAFWFGTFNQGDIFRVSEANGEWDVTKVYHYSGTDDFPPRILAVHVGPDGKSLWFSTWDEIWRMDFDEHPDHPGDATMNDGPYWWQEGVEGAAGPMDGNGDGRDTPGPGIVSILALLGLLVVCMRKMRR